MKQNHFFPAAWLLGAILGLLKGAEAQQSVHPVHPPMSDERLCVRIQRIESSKTTSTEVPLSLSSTLAATGLNQVVEWVNSPHPLRLVRYLPHAVLEQTVVPGDGKSARPAMELAVEGPTQSFRRWLIADDPQRNRLSSYIATWRFMAAADSKERNELFRQFETEFTHDPTLSVSRSDGTQALTLPLKIDATQSIEGLDCTIRVLRFFPDYALDRETNEAMNRSPQRRNPAALIEIAQNGRTEQRWVFAKFPAFASKSGELIPVRVTLDCQVETSGETPDFVLLVVAGKELEMWTRHGKNSAKSLNLTLREPVEIAGSQYKFRPLSFVPAGQMIEEYRPTEPGKGVTALQLEVPEPSGGSTLVWLALGESKTFPSAVGPVMIQFATISADTPGGHP